MKRSGLLVSADDEATLGTDPRNADTDGDGTEDGDEDFDFDGRSNGDELADGWVLDDIHPVGTDELGVAWNDPEIGADWGVTDPMVSDRDAANPRQSDIHPQWRPHEGLRT